MGFDVEFVGFLRHVYADYTAAIPVLMRWLPKMSNVDVKEDIVRNPTGRLAKPFKPVLVPLLLDEFKSGDPMDDNCRWAIGNALETVVDATDFEGIASIATDQRFGDARGMVVLALGKMRKEHREAPTSTSSTYPGP